MKFCCRRLLTQCVTFFLLMYGFTSSLLAATDEVIENTWSMWPNTIYYLAHLSGPDSPYDDIDIYITAVDEYTLYVNGNEIGTDNDWKTVEKWTVNVSHDHFVIAVKVTNYGNGNGLMVDIKANSDWMGTSTMSRRTHVVDGTRILYGVAWYYYDGNLETDLGEDWYDVDKNFFDGITKRGFNQVMLGNMGDIGYIPDNHIEIVTGYSGGVDVGSSYGGGIRLMRIEGENLALGKSAEEDELTDGILSRPHRFDSRPPKYKYYVDLEMIRRVNKVVLYTGSANPDYWERDAPISYAAEVSLNEYGYREVGTIRNIGISNADEGGYDWYAVEFPGVRARFVQYHIIEKQIMEPHIGEMMVYGTGYEYSGMYESEWIDFSYPESLKNFDKVTWGGNIPIGTNITVQTKTKCEFNNAVHVESEWSPERSERTFEFDSPEPATAFKYRVRLSTQDVDRTPEFKEFSITWSATATGITTYKPLETKLIGNIPNPFNYSTTIQFFLGSEYNGQAVQLSIFNCNGQLIRTVVNNYLNPGIHSIVWNGVDNDGDNVSSGIYISRLTTGSSVFTNKMLLMK